jgi:hypothetical protein
MKIKNSLITTCLFFLTQSCAAYPRISAKTPGVQLELIPYIQDYRYLIGEDRYSEKFKRLSANIVDMHDSTLGVCRWLLNGGTEIEINKKYWYSYNTTFYDRYFTVLHELEHCIRNRGHTDIKKEIDNLTDFFEEIGRYMGIIETKHELKDGCPASIMHSTNFSFYCQQIHYNYYLQEIRQWKK